MEFADFPVMETEEEAGVVKGKKKIKVQVPDVS